MSWTARDLMQKDVGIVDAEASLADLERAFVEARVSGFPVVQGGRVVGVVSRTDVVERLAGAHAPARLSHYYAELRGPEFSEAEELLETYSRLAAFEGRPVEELCVADVMTRHVITVSPEDPVDAVARALADHGVHRVLVTDGGSLLGIVSSLDLVRLVADGRLAASKR